MKTIKKITIILLTISSLIKLLNAQNLEQIMIEYDQDFNKIDEYLYKNPDVKNGISESDLKRYERAKFYFGTRMDPDNPQQMAKTMQEYIKTSIKSGGEKTATGFATSVGPNYMTDNFGNNGCIGRVNCVWADVNDPATVVIGTEWGGLWKTDNAFDEKSFRV